MKLIVRPSRLRGAVDIPASKSHTIRAVAIAALAAGDSTITAPLESADARSARSVYQALGARIDARPDVWHVCGFGGKPRTPDNVIDVGNSGTTLRIAMGTCALLTEGLAVLTGDAQIRRRPAGPLADALTHLGTHVRSTRNNGCAPFVIAGGYRGGIVAIEAVSSQFLTSLLLAAPLAPAETIINVPLLNERPYIEITLDWMRRQGIQLEHDDDMRRFIVPGNQSYRPVDCRVPADFSSATFFLCAGALGDNDVTSRGLDRNDSQGDKAVIDYLRQLGATVTTTADGVRITPGQLQGTDIDLNATPDALPMMAVLACFASGTTRLHNVAQARIKETDRIAVMAAELARMGARIQEQPDGLIIRESSLHGADVHGHDDHRVVMALAVAGSLAAGTTTIDTAEAMQITFPTFTDCMHALGADLELHSDDDMVPDQYTA